MCLVIRDRVAVRYRVQSLGLVQGEGNVYPVCNEGKEIVNGSSYIVLKL